MTLMELVCLLWALSEQEFTTRADFYPCSDGLSFRGRWFSFHSSSAERMFGVLLTWSNICWTLSLLADANAVLRPGTAIRQNSVTLSGPLTPPNNSTTLAAVRAEV